LQKAHVDNRGFKQFFERMEASPAAAAFLSDHPSNDERIAMAESFDNQNVTPIMTPAQWGMLKHYCGE
jgi:predicted Zn-dependent protease